VDHVLAVQRQLVEVTSHELRTPLTTIKGNLDLLEQDVSWQDHVEIVAETRQEAVRMSRLVRDLLLLAEVGGPDRQELRQIRLDCCPIYCRMRCGLRVRHPARYESVSNAMPLEHAWLLRTTGQKFRRRRWNVCSTASFAWTVAAAVARAEVGLGLAIVRHITTAHGGRVWAENRDDGTGGARFVVVLPTQPSWLETPTATSPTAEIVAAAT
jgi:signal transduction histidine kinase